MTRGSSPTARRATAQRALAARGGLWGNHGYEAAYAMVYLDGDGNALDGSNRYELRFDRDRRSARSGR